MLPSILSTFSFSISVWPPNSVNSTLKYLSNLTFPLQSYCFYFYQALLLCDPNYCNSFLSFCLLQISPLLWSILHTTTSKITKDRFNHVILCLKYSVVPYCLQIKSKTLDLAFKVFLIKSLLNFSLPMHARYLFFPIP